MATESAVYDVVFLGGGLASSMASRYLKRKHPDLRILVLEKNADTHHSPGESTVGVTGMFLIRDLGLSTYCYLNHLPKCGLRYFFRKSEEPFDESAESFDVRACSEIGPNILPILPTFQVDRKRIDRDLWRLNQDIGIEVRTGSPVTRLQVSEGGALHQVEFEQPDDSGERRSFGDGETETVHARWLVSALGRNPRFGSPFDELSPAHPDEDLRTAAAWGRFTNVRDIDLLGDDAWRARVGYTARYLSTNHLMGRGYWIWVIPIGEGVVSFGVVYDKDVLGRDLTPPEAFLDFLDEHPFSKILLEGAEQIDFQSHPHLTFKRERFCSTDRWALVGDSHGFVDPFYSPGSDSIARQAYLLEHLVLEQDDQRLAHKVDVLNEYTRYEHDLLKLLYVDQYNGFGSYEVFNIKSLWDFHSYTNRLVWFFLSQKYADMEWLERELANKDRTLQLTGAIQAGLRDLTTWLTDTGRYERHNHGHYSLRQNRFRMEEQMLAGYDDETSIGSHLHLCRLTISEMVEARFGVPDFLRCKLAQRLLSSVEVTRFELSEAWFESFCRRVARRFEAELQTRFERPFRVTVDRESFALPCPRGLENEPAQVREQAAELWSEEADNPVQEALIPNPMAV